MKDVLVIHGDFESMGGGEQVCMNIIDVLDEKYNVTILTSNYVDIEQLNEYFETNVSNVKINTLNYSFGKVNIHGYNIFNTDYFKSCITNVELLTLWILRKILLSIFILFNFLGVSTRIPELISNESIRQRVIKKKIKKINYDLIIGTGSFEISLSDSTIQYIHYPYTWEWLKRKSDLLRSTNSSLMSYDKGDFKNDKILANSKWTKSKIDQIYNCDTNVVYPPIKLSEFIGGVSRSERINGFIIAGRVSRKKRIIRSIKIIELVRKNGYDVHLRIIGPCPDDSYGRRVECIAKQKDWIYLDGKVSREKFRKLFTHYKYGIHGHDTEHFGIVVAEMVSSGIVPFVPNGGGQVEVVDSMDEIVYDTKTDAVEKITRVLDDPGLYCSIVNNLSDVPKKFSHVNFKKRILNIVADTVGDG